MRPQYGQRREFNGYPGGPPPVRGLYAAGNRNVVITKLAVGVGAIAFVLIIIMAVKPHGAAGPKTALSGIILGIAMLITALVVLPMLTRRPRPIPVYDAARYNLFRSSLDALSLGVGTQAPGLAVREVGFPDAWVEGYGARGVVAVSPGLLSMTLTDQEVEAIMAASLARMIDQADGAFLA